MKGSRKKRQIRKEEGKEDKKILKDGLDGKRKVGRKRE